MTPLELLDALKAFIEENTKDILLPVRVDRKSGEAKERPAEVYKMRLPTKDAETKRIPYVLLQYIKSTDTQTAGKCRKVRAWCELLPPPIRRTAKRAHCAS